MRIQPVDDSPFILKDGKLIFTMEKPKDLPASMVDASVNGSLRYGVYGAGYYWHTLENLFGLAMEFGDTELFNGIRTTDELTVTNSHTYYDENKPLGESDAELLTLSAFTHVEPSVTCYFHEFELASPCAAKNCPYYTPLAHQNCGYDRKEPELISLAVIAHQANEPEAFELYSSAISKIRNTEMGLSEICEPHWDVVQAEGYCSVCASEIDKDLADETGTKVHCCESCFNRLSPTGVQLQLKYRRQLKDILLETGNKYDNFRIQAEVLGISIAALQTLYIRVGINRRTIKAASKSYNATHVRPGRTISNVNYEYIAMEVVAAQQVYGDFSASLIDRLSSLRSFVQSCGIGHRTIFV